MANTCGALLPYTHVDYQFSFASPQTEAEAVEVMTTYESFLTCHEDAKLFLCGALFPSCPIGNTYRITCRELCETIVNSDCAFIIQLAGESVPDCNILPDGGNTVCVQRIAGRSFLGIQVSARYQSGGGGGTQLRIG